MIKDIVTANESAVLNDKEIKILKEHFPYCFKNDGSFDIERFKDSLKDKVDIVHEGYELKFLGKSYAKLLASVDTTTVIKPDLEHNQKSENLNSENVYISGDNLDGLKHLLKSYSGSVKCIYIDPPYNTGSDGFIYKDNFNFTVEDLVEKLSVDEVQAKRILDLTKRGSASDSAWLMFMYSRLLLAHDLLTKDGAIFISIDDNEQANLKLLCDDIFGVENFVSSIAWQSRTSIQNDTDFSINHEYVLIYARNRRQSDRRLKEKNKGAWYELPSFVCQPIPLDKGKFSNPDDDPRGLWKADPFDAPEERENLSYPIENPNTGEVYYPASGRHWSTEEEKYKKLLDDKRIIFGQNGDARPQLKVFYEEKKEFGSIDNTWFTGESVGTATSATKEQQSLFNGMSYFDTPKPTKLIEKILQLAIADKTDALVVDFFSGSATTAEAVMRSNLERKNSKLRYITIQIPDYLEKDIEKATANQKKKIKKITDFLDSVNRPHTLDQIGIERIIRAAKSIKNSSTDTNIDLGFKHYSLVEPNQNTLDKMEKFEPNTFVFDATLLSEFGKPTVLATWLIRDGYGFNAKPIEIDLGGYTVYHCEKHLYLIDSGFSSNHILAMVERYENDITFNPENVVVFGYSFDWTASNMLETNLKLLKDTEKNLKINIDTRY